MNIPFSKVSIGEEEIEAVARTYRSGWMAPGPETKAFEEEFGRYIGEWTDDNLAQSVPYCIFTGSCTAALKMAYNILKELGYTGIAYPSNTFVATYSAAAELGMDIYAYGGYDSSKWQNQLSFVHNAGKSLKMDSTAIEGSSVPSYVIEQAERELEYLQKLKLKKENVGEWTHSLDQRNSFIANNPTTEYPTDGLKDSLVKPENANTVNQQSVLSGQVQTIPTEKNGNTGSNYADVATTSTTLDSIAKVNMHFGGIQDVTPCIIEDSAHRIEKNDPLIGLIRCYSFYVTKNMTVGGQGGMFVTYNRAIYERALIYWKDGLTTSTADRMSGKVTDYTVQALVSGYDADEPRAAFGRVQLKKLPEFTNKRNIIRDRYNQAFNQEWSGNHIFPYFVNNVSEIKPFREYLRMKGIAASYHYPGTGWLGVSLPIFPSLTEDEQQYIIDAVINYKTNYLHTA